LSLYDSNHYPNLEEKPVLYVAGTEDNFAVSQMLKGDSGSEEIYEGSNGTGHLVGYSL
jgi:hypothetical protein